MENFPKGTIGVQDWMETEKHSVIQARNLFLTAMTEGKHAFDEIN